MHNYSRLLPCASMAIIFAGAFAAVWAKPPVERGLRFDSPGVLDLAEREQHRTGAAVKTNVLAPGDAAKIRATPALSEDPPALQFSDDIFGCARPSQSCSQEHERMLIDAAGAAVKRDGKRLTVTATGPAGVFVDWTLPGTRNADGDEETHWYLGTLPGSGYARVEVQFGHDAPGNFLVNPANGNVAFVHNGADVVAPSPDGMHLVTFNPLNPPLSIRIAALDGSGPKIELECAVGKDDGKTRAEFKGWHDAASLDLVIASASGTAAMRAGYAMGVWQLWTDQPGWLTSVGFACR
jgi:hypothetical protein